MKKTFFLAFVFLLTMGGTWVNAVFTVLRPNKNPEKSQIIIQYPFLEYNGETIFLQKTKNGNPVKIRRKYLAFPFNDWVSDPWSDKFCYEIFQIQNETIINSKKFCSGFSS